MNVEERINSILTANFLGSSVTGYRTFDLKELDSGHPIEIELPSNLRLGHQAEKIVAALVRYSPKYQVLYKNVQLIEEKNTIGELDFILQESGTEELIHLEMAYKFYLYDPTISSNPIENWIGPNRNDSLIKKLAKLKNRQFPLLHHDCTKSLLPDVEIGEVSQALCFLVSLYVPYEYQGRFDPDFEKAIKGFYLSLDAFTKADNPARRYYIPPRKEWGMNPCCAANWSSFADIQEYLKRCMQEKQAPLCWQKNGDSYSEFFISWW